MQALEQLKDLGPKKKEWQTRQEKDDPFIT